MEHFKLTSSAGERKFVAIKMHAYNKRIQFDFALRIEDCLDSLEFLENPPLEWKVLEYNGDNGPGGGGGGQGRLEPVPGRGGWGQT